MPTSDRTVLVYDIETNGYLQDLDRIHCISILDRADRDRVDSYAQDAKGNTPDGFLPLEEGLDRLSEADVRYAHNGLRFDEAVLRKLYPHNDWDTTLALDTQVLAQARFAHIERTDIKMMKRGKFPQGEVGKQRLRAWGYRLGVWKGDYDGGFDEWDPEMSEYCDQDVRVTDALLDVIAAHGLTQESVELEHGVSRYLNQQQINGWPFDVEAAHQLEASLRAELAEIDMQLIDRFGWWWEPKGKGDGVRTPKRDRVMRKGRLAPVRFKEGCPYVRLKKVEFNPNSRQHIEHVFRTEYGWEPEEFTPNGQAKIHESTLRGVDAPEADMIIKGLTITKRLGQLADGRRAWLKEVKEEPHLETGERHIHHVCIPGPITHRMRHMRPNLGQVPASYSPYGAECRELFTVPPGWKLMGADVSGLELRIMAHHMHPIDGGAYGETLLDPSFDSHSANAEILGLSRDAGKTWFYAWIYGAGNRKLGSIALPGCADKKKLARIGRRDRGRFERGVPVLSELVSKIKARFKHQGYVSLFDGRPAFPRGAHSAFNTLVQGDGAIVCKKWLVRTGDAFTEAFGPQGWTGKWAALGFIHDELQIAVREDIAERAGQLCVDQIAPVGEHYGLNIPLTGEYKIGDNWKGTH